MNHGILAPWAVYGALALGILLIGSAFAVLERQFYHLRRMHAAGQKRTGALEAGLAETQQEIAQCQGALREIEPLRSALVPPQPARSGLNLSNRTQALRMYRAGRDCAAIAAALQLPRAEVELLIRVQGMVLRQATPAPV